ncbi:cupin domain-containing protein [Tunturibacter empetritectus]|uniref:Cupin domain-containing protein n=1 Tax=Tunturiibacter empetritectus TaxID=3069691 RepID=A0AAU7ZIE4_9BACT
MHQPIQIGKLTITFLQSRHETQGAADVFELLIPPHAHLNIPHLHRESEETVFAMNGITTWIVDQRKITLHPGQHLRIPRGTVHSYLNDQQQTARIICLLTPGLLGPEYFHELSRILKAEDPPNLADIGSVMAHYDVIPAGLPSPPVQDHGPLILTLP